MYSILLASCLASFLAQLGAAQSAQVAMAEPQNNTFNASYGPINPTQAQSRIAQANLSDEISAAVLVAANFERSNWAGSSAQLDPFYNALPDNASSAAAGSVIKVESYTDTSLYTLAPNVALSRMIFMTKDLNGTTIPASAYVLWPWMPRQFNNITGHPVVVWGHGTSGWSSECGPSHIRNLWHQYSAPYVLALQGYVVVAPDYAGLGVGRTHNGTFIPHQFFAFPAHGNDLIYSVQAAQSAWPSLSREFVVMGQSQGGGAAWGAAQLLAQNPVSGYLGTVAASPATSLETFVSYVASVPAVVSTYLLAGGLNMRSIFPTFDLSAWVADEGVRAASLLQDLQGCQSVALELLVRPDLYNPSWNSSWYLGAFSNLTSNGGKDFAGPMLVLQGLNDTSIYAAGTTAAVNATCEAFPNRSLEYATFEGVSHVPVLYAGQQVWLDWIADRFSGVQHATGCRRTAYSPLLEVPRYQKELALFLQYPQYAYETA
jgi:alpha-beta hydrolase superfamily lysophospholipase